MVNPFNLTATIDEGDESVQIELKPSCFPSSIQILLEGHSLLKSSGMSRRPKRQQFVHHTGESNLYIDQH